MDKVFNSLHGPVGLYFRGKIIVSGNLIFRNGGVKTLVAPITVNGDLTIKGITKKTNLSGTIKVTDGKIKIASNFSIKLADYNISGQPVDAGKVAKEPKIAVSAEF